MPYYTNDCAVDYTEVMERLRIEEEEHEAREKSVAEEAGNVVLLGSKPVDPGIEPFRLEAGKINAVTIADAVICLARAGVNIHIGDIGRNPNVPV